MMNFNLLDLDNDILNIIGDYVKEDNLNSEMKRNLLEYYISSYLSYYDENDIDVSIDKINDKDYYKLLKQSDYYLLNDVYEVLSDTQKQEIREYRRKLRDFINENKSKYLDEGINFIEFPKHPEWMGDIKIPKY